jgi:phosphomannomutase
VQLSDLAASFHLPFAASDRLENVPIETSGALMAQLRASDEALASFVAPLGTIANTSDIDGLRMTLSDGRILHFRPSGNAPEMRCYVEAKTQEAALSLLEDGLSLVRRFAAAHPHP